MVTDTIAVSIIVIVCVLLSIPLGRYMARVYKGEKSVLDFVAPVEKYLYRFCKIDPEKDMGWKQYLLALLCINAVWLVWALVILLNQGKIFMNPAGNPSMDWALAFNSAISFLTSTNLQHYSGESGATYFSQLAVFMFLQFVSAATSLCAGIAVVRGLQNEGAGLGNFYVDFIKSCTRLLLPLCIITALFFLVNGMPMTLSGPQKIVTLQGDTVSAATGPVAAFVPIKELGSNGGGFFGANDAHPFENPDFITFIIHIIIVFLLPLAFIFMIGFYLKKLKFANMLVLVMMAGFVMVTIPIITQEIKGNPAIAKMGIDVSSGNIEGKEVRFGSFYSAFYAGENVVVPAGTLAGMHDSFMPLSGAAMLVAMQVDAFFGGVGTGWINMFIFLIIAIFLATLMIGRTPELFNKKLGVEEMQLAVGITVLQIAVPYLFTALAAFVYVNHPGGNGSLGWLSNPGPHGFTTMLYEFISSAAGNGSGFEGLGDNTVFWNITTGITMFCGRFIPMAGAIIIAGKLKNKKAGHESVGSLKTDSVTFGTFLFFLIIVLSVLSALPAIMLGPLSDFYVK